MGFLGLAGAAWPSCANLPSMIARHTLLAAAAAMFAAAAAGQPITEPAIAPAPPPLPRVALVTSAGTIVIALETVRAPLTSANFLRYVDQKRLDGTSFYRAVTFPSVPGFGLIQGGLRGDPKRSLKPVAHEATSQTGILHTDGTISMARAAPGTATADFFVTAGAITSLDAQPGGDPGFAAFGHVVEGMDVVRTILTAPVSATAGDGAMKGQMLAAPVRIVSVRRLP